MPSVSIRSEARLVEDTDNDFSPWTVGRGNTQIDFLARDTNAATVLKSAFCDIQTGENLDARKRWAAAAPWRRTRLDQIAIHAVAARILSKVR
jgi:hypothetical protein